MQHPNGTRSWCFIPGRRAPTPRSTSSYIPPGMTSTPAWPARPRSATTTFTTRRKISLPYTSIAAPTGATGGGADKYKAPEVSPTEKRVIDTVKWVIKQYGIDENRVYLCGNSMGGSGTLGIGMRHGDIFAAIKANVPAGIEHVSNRMYFPPRTVPADVALPDPPIVIDYSAQNDGWSKGTTASSRP